MSRRHSTDFINGASVKNALHARRFAESRGRDLNQRITIQFPAFGFTNQEAADLIKAFEKRMRDWWDYQNQKYDQAMLPDYGTFDYIAVYEAPTDLHSHMLIHAPPEYAEEIAHQARVLVQKLAGDRFKPHRLDQAIDVGDVPHSGGYLRYMLKGADPDCAPSYYIEHEPQGRIAGRRVVISRSLNEQARKRAGWSRQREAPGPNADWDSLDE